MTIPAVMLMSDAPSAYRLIGGLPLVTRHIKELYKLGARPRINTSGSARYGL